MPPEGTSLRILVVDDDPAYARLARTVVERAGIGIVTVAGSGAEALELAAGADLVLLDHQLPDGDGLSLLPAIHAMPRQPAVIMVTAHGDEALAASALRAGADDYVIKDQALPRLLPEVIERARRHRALREALGAAERDLVHAERLAAIGQLAVTISHSVNNPLMAAFAEAGLLQADRGLTAEQRGSVESIQRALARVRDIMGQVVALGHDRTTEYLDGIRMIDLSRRSGASPVYAGAALLSIGDEVLARVVASLLTHAGFAVERLAGPAELTAGAKRPGVAVVVVLGGDAPGMDPLGGFRPAPAREFTLVALAPGDGAAARAAGADHVVTLPFDPGTFVPELLSAARRLGGT